MVKLNEYKAIIVIGTIGILNIIFLIHTQNILDFLKFIPFILIVGYGVFKLLSTINDH